MLTAVAAFGSLGRPPHEAGRQSEYTQLNSYRQSAPVFKHLGLGVTQFPTIVIKNGIKMFL